MRKDAAFEIRGAPNPTTGLHPLEPGLNPRGREFLQSPPGLLHLNSLHQCLGCVARKVL
ncbi:MAG: hypothetical protein AW12_00169 [Candidatus Accumulibacter sp. BA-94]|nr:MAG: hypothetical protein AW12_00169 [Candidatus Accumulibacter sp. BA-94]